MTRETRRTCHRPCQTRAPATGIAKATEEKRKTSSRTGEEIEPLPRVLEARLSRLPEGRRRIVIGGNVILMDETTSIIVDIIAGVF